MLSHGRGSERNGETKSYFEGEARALARVSPGASETAQPWIVGEGEGRAGSGRETERDRNMTNARQQRGAGSLRTDIDRSSRSIPLPEIPGVFLSIRWHFADEIGTGTAAARFVVRDGPLVWVVSRCGDTCAFRRKRLKKPSSRDWSSTDSFWTRLIVVRLHFDRRGLCAVNLSASRHRWVVTLFDLEICWTVTPGRNVGRLPTQRSPSRFSLRLRDFCFGTSIHFQFFRYR